MGEDKRKIHLKDKAVIDPDEIIIEGPRIRNDILNELVTRFRNNKRYSERGILNIIVILDSLVERGLLKSDLLEIVRDNPDLLNKYVKHHK